MSAKKPKYRKAAGLYIKDAGKMTPKGRKAVALWLRRQAGHLMKHGDNYAPRFTAGYHY